LTKKKKKSDMVKRSID